MATWMRVLLIAIASVACNVGCEDDPTDLDYLDAQDAGKDAAGEDVPPADDEDAG